MFGKKSKEKGEGVIFINAKKPLTTLINVVITLIAGCVYFYVALPAINYQNEQLYFAIGGLCAVYFFLTLITSGINIVRTTNEYFDFAKKRCKIPLFIVTALVIVFLIGTLSSLVPFRAGDYSSLLDVKAGDFALEVDEISYDQIPMLDKNSAERLGDRKLGEMADMVSQFEVSLDYTQINYQDRPVRVTPLAYGDAIKWFNNRGEGIPAYMIIDMVTQKVDVVRLSEGMKYTPYEHFGRLLDRHLRFNYPTMMFDRPTFEIDDDGNPYYVCPTIVKRIGFFGGVDIEGAVLVNAVTGESQYYKDVPQWADRLYTAELIIEQYDYYGQYSNGFLNSLLGQKGVTVTTDGYNYIALKDDVYVYTGITSVGGDQSNIGFVLSNQRTKETSYYPVAGATEQSAAASAEGVVQHLGYKATFPLLLNISGQPTYFVALKDKSELVKMYAMVNVEQYQIVGTGESVQACEKEYIRQLLQKGLLKANVLDDFNTQGEIAEIRTAVIGGNSTYYFRLENERVYYSISAEAMPEVVAFNVGDIIEIEFDEGISGGDIIPAGSIERISRGGGETAPPSTQPPETAPQTTQPSEPAINGEDEGI